MGSTRDATILRMVGNGVGYTGPPSCIDYGLKEGLELDSHRSPVPGSHRPLLGKCLIHGESGRLPVSFRASHGNMGDGLS